ncbi:MAG: alpha/beta hydrolase [Dehalococcoidia bacterium]|nr:alpha/beta hydrolase [Dehalococcoidia bacterium]
MTTTAGYLKEMRECAEAIGLGAPEYVTPQDKWVTLNGIRMHYLDWGNDAKPPLVLLHGGSLTAHTWDMAALLLRPHYHMIALDQRGHGDTEWTPDAQLAEDNEALMLRDTEAFIDHLGYPQVILCGMSMGGNNSYRYAAKHPDRLRALVIVDVAPEIMTEGQRDMEAFRRESETLSRFEDFLDRAVSFNPNRKPAHLRYSLLHSLKQVDGGWTWKQDHRRRGAQDEAARKARTEVMWAAVKVITTPTLLMRGEVSRILSPESTAATVKAMRDCEAVVIPRATHNVQGDNPKDTAAALDAFVVKRLGAGR